jgi:hypothetical protein
MNEPTHVQSIIGGSIGIWFIFWSIRRRFGLDEFLSTQAQYVRWAIILLSLFAVLLIPEPRFALLRMFIGIIGLSFFCWPNFANRLLAVPRPPSRN